MSMITAIAWVRRGVAATFPTQATFDESEYKRIVDLTNLQLDDANEDLKDARKSVHNNSKTQIEEKNESDSDLSEQDVEMTAEEDELKKYDLDNYDNELENEEETSDKCLSMFGNLRSLLYYESNADDPYITMPENEEEDEARQELQILATDNLIIAAKVEDDIANLEIYIYEDEVDNLYVHNDIMLPATPLCLEWLDFSVGKMNADNNSSSNFVAVGMLDPDIEIWDLDTIDSMYPNAVLGQEKNGKNLDSTKKKKSRKKSKKVNDQFHVDAVLSLAANRQHRNLLASSSADKTVKLWDLSTGNCAKSYSKHTDKVCSIQWHPSDSTVLLSGSYDRTVVAADMRAPDAKAPTWGVESDVESVKWDSHDSSFFYITTENGMVHYHDVRNAPSSPAASKPVWMLQAHDKSVSAFDINPNIPGFMVTGSADKSVKLWNISASGPSMIVSRDLNVGRVFSTSFAPDQEVRFRLAVAGSKGSLQIWDTSTNLIVRNTFANVETKSANMNN